MNSTSSRRKRRLSGNATNTSSSSSSSSSCSSCSSNDDPSYNVDPNHEDPDHNDHHEQDYGIHIIDNVLTIEQCQELIAVHEAVHHVGYIDHLTVTRFVDLASSLPSTSTSSSLPSTIHLILPMIYARYKCWDKLEHVFHKQYELYPEFTSLVGWHKGSFLRNHHDNNRDYLSNRHYSAVLYLNDPITMEMESPPTTTTTTIPSASSSSGSCQKQQEHDDDEDPLSSSSSNDHKHQQHPLYSFRGGDLVFEISDPDLLLRSRQRSINNKNDDDDDDVDGDVNDAQNKDPKGHHSTQNQHQHPQNLQEYRVTPRVGRLVCFPSDSRYVHRVEQIQEGCRYVLTMWFTLNEDAMETLDSCQRLLFINNNDNNDKVDGDDNNDDPAVIEQLQQQQPWETPDQAKELLTKCMTKAKLVPIQQRKHDIDDDDDDRKNPDKRRENGDKKNDISTTTTTTTMMTSSRWTLPGLLSLEAAVAGSSKNVNNIRHSIMTQHQTELQQLVAYCWWKLQKPLGDVRVRDSNNHDNHDNNNDDSNNDNDELMNLYMSWRTYVSVRSKGLQKAVQRWKSNGMITNVTQEEMMML